MAEATPGSRAPTDDGAYLVDEIFVCTGRLLHVPNVALYQAELRPAIADTCEIACRFAQTRSRVAISSRTSFRLLDRPPLARPARRRRRRARCPLSVPNAALYQAELHPGVKTFERAYSMTVRADKLTLRDLGFDNPAAVLLHQVTDLSSFQCARRMIPLHRRWMKGATCQHTASATSAGGAKATSAAW